jgi:hypothetical protein
MDQKVKDKLKAIDSSGGFLKFQEKYPTFGKPSSPPPKPIKGSKKGSKKKKI